MAVQSTYLEALPIGYAGQVSDFGLVDIISREVETSAGIAFGVAVIQGTADHQCKLGAAGVFLGVTVRDQSVPASNGDKFIQYDTAAIMTKGVMFVTAGEAVAAGDAVYRTAAGVLNKTSSGNTLIANARWETSAASGALARLRLS